MRYFININNIFGKVITKLRKEKGLTQEKIAELANINEKYYGKIERGESSPTLIYIIKICDALEIKSYDLMKKYEDYKTRI